MPNQLITEKSPYLLQHAQNPVDWHAWNPETLDKARESGKPLLISIGYATCHWCHVMERECFEDNEIAAIMNSNFICIKVDREELPDIDQYYMNAIHLMGKQGGWPLNVFALPDGRFVWGGTYFPKQNWSDILQQLSLLFQKDNNRITEQASQIDRHLRNIKKSKVNDEEIEFDSILKKIIPKLDFENGGLKGAPKFPMPSLIMLLQVINHFHPNTKISDFLTLTLQEMAKGGIYDQIGGGFMRYSTDDQWRIPHFEKMLYDNAQMLNVYANAFSSMPSPIYLDTIKECISFLTREMKDPRGGFYSAIDADSKGQEGLYYVWTREEIEDIFNREDCELIFDFFNFDHRSCWENDLHILIPGEDNAFAEKRGLHIDEWMKQKQEIKHKLFDSRQKKTRPLTDTKRLTSWNALLIYSLIQVYRSCGEISALEAAQHGVKFVNSFRTTQGILLRHSDTRTEVYLEDYATVIRAWIAFFEISGERKWIDEAEEMTRSAFSIFADNSEMMLFEATEDSLVPVREKSFTDQVLPSSNAMMTENTVKLYYITGNNVYKKMFERLFAEISGSAVSYPEAFSFWLRIMAERKAGIYTAVATGINTPEIVLQMQKSFLPGIIFAFQTDGKPPVSVLSGYESTENASIHLCGDGYCFQPADNASEAIEMINKIRHIN